VTLEHLPNSTSLGLTDEQYSIVIAPPDARLLVTAGPGTGKTHTLIARLKHLIDEHGVSPGQELLVLSFSRAAVYEVRRRLMTAGGDVSYVRALTFDSFATRLAMQLKPDLDLSTFEYDRRIKYVTDILRTDEGAIEQLQLYRHIMVDEVQDLVGVRSVFVLALLELFNGGFTVLGDPAQGIYTFQLEGKDKEIGAATFYRNLRLSFASCLQEHNLTINHRAKTQSARSALWAGRELNSSKPNYTAICNRLETAVFGLSSLGELEDAKRILHRPGRTTAVLTRTNGQALFISRILWESGIRHSLQRRATDRAVPPWLAQLVQGIDRRVVSQRIVLQRLESVSLPEKVAPSEAWVILKSMDGRPGDTVDLSRLAERIRIGAVPDEVLEHPEVDFTISTVHRAKGMEFDRVVLARPQLIDIDEDANPADLAEETRVLYVALTRPKKDLLHVEIPKLRGLFKHSAVERWVRRYEAWRYREIEVRGDDTHALDPAGGYLISDNHPVELQRYLSSSVNSGDPVVLTRIVLLCQFRRGR
jgi:superfamily I DNA/RNA helicase